MLPGTTELATFKDYDFSKLKMIPMIVIYKKPLDYPDKYVARLWDTNKVTEFAVIKDTLEEVRAEIPEGMNRLAPSSGDDHVIEEVWL